MENIPEFERVHNELVSEMLELEADINQQILDFEKRWQEKYYANVLLMPMDQLHPGYDKIIKRGGHIQFAPATVCHG